MARGGHVVQGGHGLAEVVVRFVIGLVGACLVPGSCERVGHADPEAGLFHIGREDRSGGDAGVVGQCGCRRGRRDCESQYGSENRNKLTYHVSLPLVGRMILPDPDLCRRNMATRFIGCYLGNSGRMPAREAQVRSVLRRSLLRRIKWRMTLRRLATAAGAPSLLDVLCAYVWPNGSFRMNGVRSSDTRVAEIPSAA